MGYEVKWLDESQTILFARFGTEVTYEEIFEMFDQCDAMLTASAYPVVVAFDLGDLKVMQKFNINAVRKMNIHPLGSNPNRGATYVLNMGVKSRMLVEMASKVFPRTMKGLITGLTLEEVVESTAESREALLTS